MSLLTQKIEAVAHPYKIGELEIGDLFVVPGNRHLCMKTGQPSTFVSFTSGTPDILEPNTVVNRCEGELKYWLVYRYEKAETV